MTDKTHAQRKTLQGMVTSDKMTRTVVVQVTTFKQHPLYHKRYRWTKKYLADTGELSPKPGETVRIVSSRPLSKLKRWVVTEVVTPATQEKQRTVRRTTTRAKAAAPKKVAAKKK